MKATKTEKLVIVFTLLFLVFTIGVHLGTGRSRTDMVVTSAEAPRETAAALPVHEENESEKAEPGAVVNINTATSEQLQTLDGIGEKLAERIIAYREANGDFEKPDDITKVSGIGNGIYLKICDSITVE